MFNSKVIYITGVLFLSVLTATCGGRTEIPAGTSVKADASSTLPSAGNKYSASNIVDGLDKSWCEGKADAGSGVSLTLSFLSSAGKATTIATDTIYIRNGFGKEKYYSSNNRIKEIEIAAGENTAIKELQDTNKWQEVNLPFTFKGDQLQMTIVSVYAGAKFNDTCVTEASIYPEGNSQSAASEGTEANAFSIFNPDLSYVIDSEQEDDSLPCGLLGFSEKNGSNQFQCTYEPPCVGVECDALWEGICKQSDGKPNNFDCQSNPCKGEACKLVEVKQTFSFRLVFKDGKAYINSGQVKEFGP